jgi:hypothetical protein
MEILLGISKFAIKSIFNKKDYSWLFKLWDFSLKTNKLYFYISLILMTIEVIFDTFEPYYLGQLTKLLIIKELDMAKLSKFNYI